jgi:hypothetical protein
VSEAVAHTPSREPVARLLVVGALVVAAAVLAGCQRIEPEAHARTFYDFKEDSVARDGVLSRCDKTPEAAATDQECVAAKRAAAAVAVELERSRSGALEQQSERKLVALRDHAGGQSETASESPSAPAFGAPLGAKLPSMTDSTDPYDVQFPSRPAFKLGELEPPASEIEIVRPQLKPEDVAVVTPRLPAAN